MGIKKKEQFCRGRANSEELRAEDIEEPKYPLEDMLIETTISYKGHQITECPACHTRIMKSGINAFDRQVFGIISYTCPECELEMTFSDI